MAQITDEEIQKQLNLKETPEQTRERICKAQEEAMRKLIKGLTECR